jgi:hypothetical protein
MWYWCHLDEHHRAWLLGEYRPESLDHSADLGVARLAADALEGVGPGEAGAPTPTTCHDGRATRRNARTASAQISQVKAAGDTPALTLDPASQGRLIETQFTTLHYFCIDGIHHKSLRQRSP